MAQCFKHLYLITCIVWLVGLMVLSDDELMRMVEEQKRELRISDNRIFELSKWDKTHFRKELMELEEIVGVQREEVQSVVAELRRDFSQGYEKAVERAETRFESKQVLMREFSCPSCGETVSVREDNLYDE